MITSTREVSMRRKICAIGRSVVLSTLALLVFCGGAKAQNVTSATLSGIVEDANGASIPGASVTATQVETNQQRATTSDRDGHFKFPYLPVGNYQLTINEPGFTTLARRVTLNVGQALYLVFNLDVKGLAENLTIKDVSTIETTRSQVTETIRPAEINQLPLNGRNYLDLALLVPAVAPTNTGSNQRFAETS